MTKGNKPEPEIIINGGEYDATELIRKIRAEVEQQTRREYAVTELRPGVSAKLHDELALLNLESRIDTVTVARSDRAVFGPLINLVKRLLRPFLRWFVVPIVDRVSDFNMQLVGFLYHQLEYLDRQSGQELAARVARLERSRLAAVDLPEVGKQTPVDITRYYEKFVAPRREELAAALPYFARTEKIIVLGSGKGEIGEFSADIEFRLIERNAELLPVTGTNKIVSDYLQFLQETELHKTSLLLDDYLGDWGSQRLQAAFNLFAARGTAGQQLIYLAPTPQAPPYPLLRLDLYVEPPLAAFLLESAGYKQIELHDPLPGTGKCLLRGTI